MHRFDILDMRLISAVARSGSITAGAAEIHLAVGSASERIKVLEATLGVCLFTRVTRGVIPTSAGQIVLRHAHAMLGTAEAMASDLSKLQHGLNGEVRVATNSVALTRAMREPLIAFLRDNPGINVSLNEVPSSDAQQLVLQGKADIAVAAIGTTHADIEARPLFVDRLAAVAARTDPVAAKHRISFAELLNYDLLMLSARSALHAYLSAKATELGRGIRSRVGVDDLPTMCRMAEAGLGIGVAPVGSVHTLARSMNLRLVPFEDAWAERRIGIMWNRQQRLGAPGERFVACLIEASSQEPFD